MKRILFLSVVFLLGAGCTSTTSPVVTADFPVEPFESEPLTPSQMKSPLENAYFTMVSSDELPSHNLRCLPVYRFNCGSGKCEKANPSVFTLVQELALEGKVIYYRCDSKGCDSYGGNRSDSGFFSTILPENTSNAFVFKRATVQHPDDLERTELRYDYTEIVTIATASIVQEGYCETVSF